MRLVGVAERALEHMCKRSLARVTFGKPIAERTVTQERIAEARIMIESARLLVLKAASMMDTVGNKAARAEIAMIKVLAPNVACKVLDWAIQAHGGGGMSEDFRSPTCTPTRARCASPTGRTKCTATRLPARALETPAGAKALTQRDSRSLRHPFRSGSGGTGAACVRSHGDVGERRLGHLTVSTSEGLRCAYTSTLIVIEVLPTRTISQ